MKNKIKGAAVTLLGAMICGFAEGFFLFNTKIVSGGFSGIANILYNTLGFAPIIIVPLLNLLASLLAVKKLGVEFLIRTFITNAVFSASIQLFALMPPITDDLLTCCALGGVLSGIGTALIMAENATRGGTDIVARFIQKKRPEFPIGKFLLILDGLVILAAFVVYDAKELSFYGFLTLVFETTVVDIMIRKLNKCNMLMIVTENEEDVKKSLIENSERGLTVLNGVGGYTNNPKGVLMICIKNREVETVYKAVKTVDEEAFIVNLHSNEVNGEGFNVYR